MPINNPQVKLTGSGCYDTTTPNGNAAKGVTVNGLQNMEWNIYLKVTVTVTSHYADNNSGIDLVFYDPTQPNEGDWHRTATPFDVNNQASDSSDITVGNFYPGGMGRYAPGDVYQWDWTITINENKTAQQWEIAANPTDPYSADEVLNIEYEFIGYEETPYSSISGIVFDPPEKAWDICIFVEYNNDIQEKDFLWIVDDEGTYNIPIHPYIYFENAPSPENPDEIKMAVTLRKAEGCIPYGEDSYGWFYNQKIEVFMSENEDEIINYTSLNYVNTEIRNRDDLYNMRYGVKYDYILIDDIDLNGEDWEPIKGEPYTAEAPHPFPYFSGSFDMNGYTIKNFDIHQCTIGTDKYTGFFNETNGATIENGKLIANNVTGNDYTGIIVGYSDSSSFKTIHVEGSINNTVLDTGGIVGTGWNDYFYFCTADVVMDVNTDYVGGICGYDGGNTIEQCFAIVDININDYQFGGGIAGNVGSGMIVKNCYSRGVVAGANCLGGLIGMYGGQVDDCYAACEIKPLNADLPSGGLIGYDWTGDLVINNSYYDQEVSGYTDTDRGLPRTTAEMTESTESSYDDTTTYIGWDFTNVWNITKWRNEGYPVFRWIYTAKSNGTRGKGIGQTFLDAIIFRRAATPDLGCVLYGVKIEFNVLKNRGDNY